MTLRLIALGLLLSCGLRAADPAPPNILIILADDLGYSDIGCYGGEIRTPALNRLAAEGVRLTRFQNGGMCVVSRASMLTGNYWASMKKRFPKTPLLSEKLQESGYRSALIGKWHLRGDPLDRGFDHFFGLTNGAADHFSGNANFKLDRAPFKDFGKDYYSTDEFTRRAIHFISTSPKGQEAKPFFLYLSYQAPHSPLQAPKDDILRHRGGYRDGWQAVREARFKRQKQLGLVPADSKLPDYPQNLPQWTSLSPEQRDLEDLRMSVYAAMVERMDRGIGQVLKALADSGKLDNTLIVFLSDNGSDSFSSATENLLKSGKLPGDPKSNFQPGTGWAYASGTPWRLYKISQHSGGMTTGAIVRWPGKTGAPGRIESTPVHMIDLLPTLLEAARQSARNLKISGESFLPLLKGGPWNRNTPLFGQFTDNRSIRTAEWTMAEVDGSGWELFKPATDPFENTDLAVKFPEVVAKLDRQWLQWWESENGEPGYAPQSTGGDGGYEPQGDRGSGKHYVPGAMPASLADRYPVP